MRALFPASFDPVTNGHMDILNRVSVVFDSVVAGVVDNARAGNLFATQERVDLLQSAVVSLDNVEVLPYTGLTVDFARQVKASVLVRGLRAVSDFEYEFALSAMNRRLHPDIDTMFFLSAPEHSFVSSSLIREIGALGRSVEPFVPANVNEAICKKFAQSADRR
ncbi:MAG: pantetheine-phosphate adenylyltransferase [Chloroflexi bacterium]|nr:pantetheine-phosphate adenylyltransferase [Chloroflexota bacterium]|tara:strand:- start:2782 stop:3273 length:492 start_codon:yes stop_codon:yes gene_type:complete